jgi:pimeloyl-ACP methyl ester carboxylesterase
MDWVLRILILHFILCGLPVFVGSCMLAMERGTPIRISRIGASWFFREWAAHVVIVPLLATGWWPTLPRSLASPGDLAEALPSDTDRPERTPVLLVHGYGRNRACFRFLSIYLRTRGWSWVWANNHRPWSSPIPVFAENLSRAVDLLMEASGSDKVDIVAHSMGGLVAAWYLAELDGQHKVRRLVTMGTPWKGSKAHVFALREEGRDLAPESPVIAQVADLNHDIVAIFSDSDPKVFPASSCRHPHAECIELPDIGHLEMLMSARSFRAVVDALSRPEAQ